MQGEVEIQVASVTLINSEQPDLENFTREHTISICEGDAEEWLRNNSLKKTMLHKANLLTRMGLGPKAFQSLSREQARKLALYQDRERRSFQELEEPILKMTKSYSEPINSSDTDNDFELDLFERTDSEIRSNYINKLVGMKIMKLQPSKKHQSVIIFDWDDTLLCTSYLQKLGVIDVACNNTMQPFKTLDLASSKLLQKVIEYGEVFIVTNSEEGWIPYSGRIFLPQTLQVIKDNNIQIISARTKFQKTFPSDHCRWKTEAFLTLRKNYNHDVITNLICLGDSNIEMEAAHVLAKHFLQVMTKTIKFKENPLPNELIKQVELVGERFDTIFTKLKNLTVRLEKRTGEGK